MWGGEGERRLGCCSANDELKDLVHILDHAHATAGPSQACRREENLITCPSLATRSGKPLKDRLSQIVSNFLESIRRRIMVRDPQRKHQARSYNVSWIDNRHDFPHPLVARYSSAREFSFGAREHALDCSVHLKEQHRRGHRPPLDSSLR